MDPAQQRAGRTSGNGETITYQGSLKELKFSNPKEERTEVFKHIKRHNHCSLSVMEERRKKKKKKEGLSHSRKGSI